MIELLLVSMFTAFVLALLDSVIDFLAIMISPKAINAILSLGMSSLGNYLIGTHMDKSALVKIIAGAFLGRAFITTVDRLTVYRQVTIRQ